MGLSESEFRERSGRINVIEQSIRSFHKDCRRHSTRGEVVHPTKRSVLEQSDSSPGRIGLAGQSVFYELFHGLRKRIYELFHGLRKRI